MSKHSERPNVAVKTLREHFAIRFPIIIIIITTKDMLIIILSICLLVNMNCLFVWS